VIITEFTNLHVIHSGVHFFLMHYSPSCPRISECWKHISSPCGSPDPKGQPKSRIKAPPSSPSIHSSPSSSITSSPILLTLLTSESLAFAEAIDNFEADASLPSTPTHSCSQSPSFHPTANRTKPHQKTFEAINVQGISHFFCTLQSRRRAPRVHGYRLCLEAFNEESGDQRSPYLG